MYSLLELDKLMQFIKNASFPNVSQLGVIFVDESSFHHLSYFWLLGNIMFICSSLKETTCNLVSFVEGFSGYSQHSSQVCSNTLDRLLLKCNLDHLQAFRGHPWTSC
jgi:hypothetical protein